MIYPQAIWRDVGAPGNYSNGRMNSYLGLVLHTNEANSEDLFGWITGNHNMSCHFQLTKDGTLYQYIDTAFSSWCQSDGNDDYLSIETEGFHTEPLTDPQVQMLAMLYKWLHDMHGLPFALAEKPGDKGFAWHGMGGEAWGGHVNCPGEPKKSQRQLILDLAKTTSTDPEIGELFDMISQDDQIRVVQRVDAIFNQLKNLVDGAYAVNRQVIPTLTSVAAKVNALGDDETVILAALEALPAKTLTALADGLAQYRSKP